MAIGLTCARCGSMLPPDARFCQSCGAPVAEAPREERRIVTVLFGDLSGFTEFSEARDAEVVKGVVDRAFTRTAEIIARYGGHIDKIIGDEIMAVFGAPVAHEDDAERAVRAALAIQRDLAEQSADVERAHGVPLRMHIGVNTGEVVAGFVAGSDSYTVLGDTVNTARRIGDVAEAAQILAGEPTVEASTGAIEYRRIGQVTAKGKRLPVVVYEAVAETELPGTRTIRAAPLIGREEELSLLESLARIVYRDTRPLVATLVGEAGMGKSRLAAEFARRLSAHGVRVLNGRSLPYGTASAAFALEEMVRQALLVDPGADAQAVRERLEELGLTAETDDLLSFLGFGGDKPGGNDAPGPGPPSAFRSPLVDAAIAVLRRTAEREKMLVCAFHELHWAEEEVLEAVLRLAREGRAPLLMVCLARPEFLERRPDWSSALGSTVLPLEPLQRARAAEMLDVLAPSLPPHVRESVLDRAGGNPFYLEELARLYVDDRAEGFAVPGTVQALVTARLDALPPAEKRLLQDAAVIGEQFWLGAIEHLRGTDDPSQADTIAALVAQGFIEPSGRAPLEGQDAYRFRQTLVREVAYASVPKNARARQHEEVAQWLEELASGQEKDRELDDLIGYHFERAAVLAREVGTADPVIEAKARAYLIRAGDASLGRDAATAASEFYERALAFATDADDSDVRLRLADTLVGTFRHDRARTHIDAVLERARAQGDRATEGNALRLLADSLRMQGKREEAAEPLERALAIARETDNAREEAAATRSKGLLDMTSGRLTQAVESFERALARYRELGDARGEGWCLQNLGWANMLMGLHEEALDHLAQGERVFAALDDEEGVGWCTSMRAWVLMLRGDLTEAASIAEGLEHHLTVNHPAYAATAGFALELQRVLRAFVAIARGQLVEAERIGRAAVDRGNWSGAKWALALGQFPLVVVQLLGRRFDEVREATSAGRIGKGLTGDPFYDQLFAFAFAWLALEEGRYDDAERMILEQADRGETGALWARSVGARWVLASAFRARGESDRARELLAERLEVKTTGSAWANLTPPALWARALFAELLAEAGDVDAAREQIDRALTESGEVVLGRIVALEARARVELGAGDADAADRALRDALSLLAETDWLAERVRVLALHARVLDALRRHDEADETLDRARATLGEFPAGSDTATLEGLLRE